MTRTRTPSDPVTLWLDGEAVVAQRGEPAAVALVADGRLAMARSPKFHRPRGPSCFAGACDGCLARVDDVPNVMTCRVPATEGMRIETQNVVGSRETDLLRVADWFFPDGLNHHELLAGVPGMQRVVQGVARQVAGLGRLPALEPTAQAIRPARRRDVDVLVVGAGAAGMAASLALAGRGRRVEVVDDDLAPGGSAGILARLGEPGWGTLLNAFDALVSKGGATLRSRTTVAGVYGDDVLVASEAGEPLEVLTARTLVLATGGHDGALAFEGNDLPGVMSARAGCRLLSHGVAPGKSVVVVGEAEGGAFGAAVAQALAGVTLVVGLPLRAEGRARVKGVTVATAGGERVFECDALLLDVPPAPAYAIAVQAGASVTRLRAGFTVKTSSSGQVRDGVFALGEACGTALDVNAMTRAATALAKNS